MKVKLSTLLLGLMLCGFAFGDDSYEAVDTEELMTTLEKSCVEQWRTCHNRCPNSRHYYKCADRCEDAYNYCVRRPS